MKTALWIGLAAVIGLAASGKWLVSGPAEAATKTSSATLCKVARGDLRIAVEENGFMAAKDNVKISPKFKGSGTITKLLEEGKSVVPGDVLVEFDKTQLETQISDLENQLTQYEIEHEAAKANLEIQERDNQASIEKAELTSQMAQLTLERYEQGDAPNELRKLNLAAEKAQSELDRQKERFEQVPALVEQGFLTRIQEEEERIKVREAEINKENAEKDLELHQAYTARMDHTKKESDVKDAERELENARKKADINLKEKQAALAQRERQVTSTKNRLDQQRTELLNYTIKAENPGILHYGDPDNPWFRQEVKVGNSAYQGQTLVTIPDLTTMQVLIQVHEADIDKIKLDMPVVVTVDSRKGETYSGKITEIASVATSTNWSDESNKSFKVEVTLDSTTSDLRAGVTAKAEITIETLAGVLYVPIHAIVPEGAKHLAFLKTPDGHEEREVKIGKNNAHYVEVLEGLAEGDEILLYDPRDESGVHAATENPDAPKPTPATESPLPGASAAGVSSVSEAVLELTGLTKEFGAGENLIRVLHGLDCTVRTGELLGIVGQSGSGKTTLLNILGCLDLPSGGSYRLAGRDVAKLDDDELARVRNRSIGFVFQSFQLIPQLDVLENVELPLFYEGTPRKTRRARCEELLASVGMSHRLRSYPTQLSGGECQRVAIARALVNKPALLLADEPTGNLDTKNGAEVMQLFRRLHAEGRTIVMVTHNPEIAAALPRVVELQDGRIVRDGPPETGRAEATVIVPRPADSRPTDPLVAGAHA